MKQNGTFSLLLLVGLLAGVCLLAGCVDETAHDHPPVSPPSGENGHDWIFIGTGDQTVDTRLSVGLYLLKFHLKKPADSYPDDSMVEIMTEHNGFMIRGSYTRVHI